MVDEEKSRRMSYNIIHAMQHRKVKIKQITLLLPCSGPEDSSP
jgi:hypothetical protein